MTWPKFRLENNSYLRKYYIIASNLSVCKLQVCKSFSQSWLVASIRVIGRCAHFNVKLLHFNFNFPEDPLVKKKIWNICLEFWTCPWSRCRWKMEWLESLVLQENCINLMICSCMCEWVKIFRCEVSFPCKLLIVKNCFFPVTFTGISNSTNFHWNIWRGTETRQIFRDVALGFYFTSHTLKKWKIEIQWMKLWPTRRVECIVGLSIDHFVICRTNI